MYATGADAVTRSAVQSSAEPDLMQGHIEAVSVSNWTLANVPCTAPLSLFLILSLN